MTNNLFVTFDVHDTSREASLILSAIEELGQAVRIFSFLWYVRSNLSASEAAERVWDVMDPQDRLLVIDASRQEVASLNLDELCVQWMTNRWHRDLEDRDVQDAEPARVVEPLVAVTPARDLRAAAG
jgi:hypothetical protein